MLVYVLKQNGQPFMPTERFDKVKYLGKEYFIKGRQSKGGYVFLMDIFNGQIDFSYMPRGHKIPKLLDCERVSARSSVLYIRMKYRTEYVEGMKYIEVLE